jgi:lipid-A-disaccharide synthase-like uncharacterized protein
LHALAQFFPQMAAEPWWFIFSFIAQAVFFMRFFVQWLATEREKKSVVPNAFWYLSLAGGVALLAYTVHQRNMVLSFGQAGGLIIYLRNVMLIHKKHGRLIAVGFIALAAALVAAILAAPPGVHKAAEAHDLYWTLFGFAAQGCFFLRFFVQWLMSERSKRSVMPESFW